MKYFFALMAMMAMAFDSSYLLGDLVITIGPAADVETVPGMGVDVDAPVDVAAGQTGVSISVFAHENSGVPLTLASFTLPFDFVPGGAATLSPFADVTFSSPASGLSSGVLNQFPEPATFNFAYSGSGTGESISNDPSIPTELFRFNFNIDASAAPGLYDITAVPIPGFTVFNEPGPTAIPVGVQFDNGQIRIAAVPEPTSLAIVLLSIGGVALRRKRAAM